MAVLSGILSYSLKLGVHIFSSVVDFTEFLSNFFHLNGRTLFYNRATLIIKPLFVSFLISQIVKLNFRYLLTFYNIFFLFFLRR